MNLEAVKIARAARVSGTAKALLLDLSIYADSNGCAWPAIETLASDLAVDPGNVRRAIYQLKGLGVLQTSEGRGRGRTMTIQFCALSHGFGQEKCAPAHENENKRYAPAHEAALEYSAPAHEKVCEKCAPPHAPNKDEEGRVKENEGAHTPAGEGSVRAGADLQLDFGNALGGKTAARFDPEAGFAEFWADYPATCPRKIEKAKCAEFYKKKYPIG